MPSWKDDPVLVQGQEPSPVPWWVARLAYRDYVRQFGNRQSLHTILRRGGFGQNELIHHLANLARQLIEEKETSTNG